MRVVFAGTPDFAVPSLLAILDRGHDVALVLTQPDRPAGRGMAPAPSAVKQAATERGLRVSQPTSLKGPEAQAPIAEAAPDAMVVAAYGLILPQRVLDVPRYGALNVHASLLPRWRGAAPIHRALLAGDSETGICIMRMEAGLDTGPVLLREATPVGPEDTFGSLHDRLAAIGARLVVAALDALAAGSATATPQPAEGATYARKLEKTDARIDWTRAASEIARQVRAFVPAPGAAATIRGAVVKVWRATVLPGEDAPAGTIVAASGAGIDVATGAGRLRILELQRAGARRLDADAFLRGFPLSAGDRFDDGAAREG